MPTRGVTRKRRSSSASTLRRRGSGARPSTAGSVRSRSIPLTPPPSTIWQSPTSTKGNSKRRGSRTRKRPSSSRTTRCFGRTTICSRKSMTVRTAAALSSAALVLVVSGCTSFYEIPIETPIQPKMDVTPFQRVFIAGFIAGGSEDVDANLETVRLLRSQLRSKSPLRVIEADVLPLVDLAREQAAPEGGAVPSLPPQAPAAPTGERAPAAGTDSAAPAERTAGGAASGATDEPAPAPGSATGGSAPAGSAPAGSAPAGSP